jgi:hypothetical protein
MTKESKNLHPEQSTISKLHQSLKVEEPSAQMDKTILTKAKLQLESQIPKVDKVTPINTRRSWHKWQWPVSVAASALFVSLIFVGQYEFFTNNQGIYPDAEQAGIEAFDMAKPVQSVHDKPSALPLDAEHEDEVVQVTAQRLAKEQTQTGLDATSSRLQQHEQEQGQQFATEQHDAQRAKMKMASALKDQNYIVSAQIAQLQHELNTKSELLASVNKQQVKLFTDTLVELTEAKTSLAKVEKPELEEQITLLQIELMEQMHKKLKIQQDWQAPKALLDLLSPVQQAQWPSQNRQEHKE